MRKDRFQTPSSQVGLSTDGGVVEPQHSIATLVIFRIVYYTFSTSILYNDWMCLQTGYLFASYLRLAVVYFFQYPTSIAHFAHFFFEVRTGVYPGYLGELARYFGSASQVDVTTSEISVAISAAS